jgi:hypothetical protein
MFFIKLASPFEIKLSNKLGHVIPDNEGTIVYGVSPVAGTVKF